MSLSAAEAAHPPRWGWALVLVAALHLLTTPGIWYVTDQAEALFTARRLLDHGTLTLAEAGAPRIPPIPWVVARPGEPYRSRLLPATALALSPLLLLDRWLGFEEPRQFGRLVHLQGHLFVLAALALLGAAARRAGMGEGATALAVAATGTAWPVWQVSRRGGPEAILLLLVAAWLWAGSGDRRTSRGRWTRAAVCALLPWTHSTGTVLAATLLAASAWQVRATLREPGWRDALAIEVAGGFAGIASVIVGWNHLYHGNWWAGGYGLYRPDTYLGAHSPLRGLAVHLQAVALQLPVLLALAALALRRSRRPVPGAVELASLGAVLLVFYSTFYAPEPARRLSVLAPPLGLVAAAGAETGAVRRLFGPLALAAAALLGFYWFVQVEGRYYLGPGGLYYPGVLWIELSLKGRPWWQTALPSAVLAAAASLAGARVARLVRP